MAPKKGTKRTATQGASAPAEVKKPKCDPMHRAVAEAIDQSEALSESCRAMLKAAIPGCLDVPTEERQEIQAQIVQMIGEVLEGIEAKLQEVLEAERSKVAGAETSKGDLGAKVSEAEACFEEAKQVVDKKKQALADATMDMTNAKTTLSEKQEVQRDGDKSLIHAREAKDALDEVVEGELQAIKAGTPGAHYTAVLPVLQTLTLDESLMTALPSTCMKAPSDRGAFDHMVIEQLEKSLSDRGSELAKTLEDGAPAAAERAADVEAAQSNLTALTEAQMKAAAELALAQASQQEASATVDADKVAVRNFEPEHQKAVQACEEKAADLENFRAYNLACFKMLRDKTAVKVVAEASPEVKELPAPAATEAFEAGVPLVVGGA